MDALIRHFLPEDYAAICSLEEGERGARYPASVFIRQASVLYPKTFLVAIASENLAGYCIGATPENSPSLAWVLRLRISIPFRRRYIGSDLLRDLIEEFSQKNIRKVLLSVAPDNTAAVALYDKFGFEIQEFQKGYFGPGEDRIIMVFQM